MTFQDSIVLQTSLTNSHPYSQQITSPQFTHEPSLSRSLIDLSESLYILQTSLTAAMCCYHFTLLPVVVTLHLEMNMAMLTSVGCLRPIKCQHDLMYGWWCSSQCKPEVSWALGAGVRSLPRHTLLETDHFSLRHLSLKLHIPTKKIPFGANCGLYRSLVIYVSFLHARPATPNGVRHQNKACSIRKLPKQWS